MVGLVVLGGLLILAWMLLRFGSNLVSPFSPASMGVHFLSDRSDGISNGSSVIYRGVVVGRVETITRDDDQIHVKIDGQLDQQPPLPANVRAIIRSQGLVGGGASIVLELVDPTPQGQLKPEQTIQTHFVGLDILPAEFSDLATELQKTSRTLRESNVIEHLDEQIVKVGKLIDSVQSIVGDPQMHSDLSKSLANIRETTEKADRVADDLDKLTLNANDAVTKTQSQVTDLSKQLSDRMQQVSKLLDQFQSIAEKVNTGQGSAGQIVNDPKLYQSMVDTARELNSTVVDLHRLVDQWEQEGVTLKVK